MTATTPADETAHDLRCAVRAWWPAAEFEEQSDAFEAGLGRQLGIDVERRVAELRRALRDHVLQLAHDAEMPERMDRALLDQVGEASWDFAGEPLSPSRDAAEPPTAEKTAELAAVAVAASLRRLADALEDIEAACDEGDAALRRLVLSFLEAQLANRKLPRRPLWQPLPADEKAVLDRFEAAADRFDAGVIEWLDHVVDGSISAAVTIATPPAEQRRA